MLLPKQQKTFRSIVSLGEGGNFIFRPDLDQAEIRKQLDLPCLANRRDCFDLLSLYSLLHSFLHQEDEILL